VNIFYFLRKAWIHWYVAPSKLDSPMNESVFFTNLTNVTSYIIETMLFLALGRAHFFLLDKQKYTLYLRKML
jgi:hypothetical protein